MSPLCKLHLMNYDVTKNILHLNKRAAYSKNTYVINTPESRQNRRNLGRVSSRSDLWDCCLLTICSNTNFNTNAFLFRLDKYLLFLCFETNCCKDTGKAEPAVYLSRLLGN